MECLKVFDYVIFVSLVLTVFIIDARLGPNRDKG